LTGPSSVNFEVLRSDSGKIEDLCDEDKRDDEDEESAETGREGEGDRRRFLLWSSVELETMSPAFLSSRSSEEEE